jgi:hypothetical protein
MAAPLRPIDKHKEKLDPHPPTPSSSTVGFDLAIATATTASILATEKIFYGKPGWRLHGLGEAPKL